MENVRKTADDSERLGATLSGRFPPDLVNFLFSPRLEQEGYETSPIPTSTESYRVLISEKWNSGNRELIGYIDGTVTLKLQEKDEDIDIHVVLTRDGRVHLDGTLPFSYLIGTLWFARQNNLLSGQNLITPDSIIQSIDFLKFLNPQKAMETEGVKCSFESDSQRKLLIKGIYLA